LYDEDSYPRRPASLVEGPTVRREAGRVIIRFSLDQPDDVLVRIVDSRENTIRHLACGVLGKNTPAPFKAESLRQELVWDGQDDEGKPVRGPCKVRVAVGLRPRFDRFVGYDPAQMLNHVRGLEVDPEGRVYVSMIPGAMAEAEVVRFDREGRHLDTINPINPNLLPGRLEEIYPEWNTVDGTSVPAYRGYRPIFWFYCTGGAFHPIRIASDGKIHIACVQQWFSLGPRAGPTIYTVEKTDPFWFRKPLWTQLIVWAIDRQGFAYYRDVRANKDKGSPPSVVIRKINITTGKPARDFAYEGTEKLSEKRDYLGTAGQAGGNVLLIDYRSGFDFLLNRSAADGNGPRDGKRFAVARDIAVDRAGNLFVADATSVKVYAADGKFLRAIDRFELEGKEQPLGRPFGVRAAAAALYVVAKLERTAGANLVKFRLGSEGEPTAVWRQPLHAEAKLVAVDEAVSPPIVWVGNGGGPATLTRIVDQGDRPVPPRHLGGLRKGIFPAPQAVALDGRGRIFVQDSEWGKLIRTSDDGSEWVEAEENADKLYSLLVDKKRGHLYRLDGDGGDRNLCRRYDLDMKYSLPLEGTDHTNLGGIDPQGNVYVAQSPTGVWADGTGPRIDQFGPDGRLKKKAACEVFAGRGACAVDSQGFFYVMDTCETLTGGRKGAPGPGAFHDLGRPPGPRWQRGDKKYWSQSDVCYLVKFDPRGGRRGSPTELWAHLGASPVMYHCSCRTTTNNVAVDDSMRVFVTDTTKYHVKVLDAAGNLMARVGAWGHYDCRGPQSKYPRPEIAFDWPYSLDACADALYVSDKRLRRIVKVRMDYREAKEVVLSQ
jgi:DNA-binding beta-propeller fold protein YncE